MRKVYLTLAAMAFAAFCFAGGVFYGFREGVRNVVMLEEIAQGALSRHQLASFEKGLLDNAISFNEIKIDTGLHRYVMYQESDNKFLSEIFLPESTSHIEGYVDLMVNYRKSHPIVFNSNWTLPVESDDEISKQAKAQGYEISEKMVADIRQLLRSRGVSEAALVEQGGRSK